LYIKQHKHLSYLVQLENYLIPDEYIDLVKGKNLGHLATKNSDGTLQISPVWVDYNDISGNLMINSAIGRRKVKNMKITAPVAISIVDSDNPGRYLSIEGVVDEHIIDGAEEHLHKLNKRYTSTDTFEIASSKQRIIIVIKPIKILTGNYKKI